MLTPFRAFNNIGEGLVALSALKAGGFTPVFQNEHYAYMQSLEMLALGGIIIMLPDAQHEEAHDYMRFLAETTVETGEPVAHKKHEGWLKSSVFAGLVMPFLLPILAPMTFFPVIWLCVVGLILVCLDHIFLRMLGIALLTMSPILLHAQYIALPRMRKSHEP